LATQVLDQSTTTAVQRSPALINFIESLSSSKDTRDAYMENLKMFMKFHNTKDPQELLKWDPKIIESRIIAYIVSARNRGRAQRSINMYYSILKHFFKMNDVVLNWDKVKRFVGKANGKKANDRPYTHAEIHKLLEHATPRERVLILLMCSAGLRSGGIPGLKVGHLRRIEDFGQKIYEITVYAGTDDEYTTYCTPECAAAIDTYLQFRKTRLHETITDETPLVINIENKDMPRNCRDTSQAITVQNVKQVIYRLLRDVGIRNTENKKQMYSGDRHQTATCHSLRKFFRSQLKFAGVDHLDAETLLGHSTGLVGIYTKIPEEQLIQSYLRAVNNLTIDESNRLREKVKKLELDASQLDYLTKRFAELEKKIDLSGSGSSGS
jgi:site-specific recombinase XerD